MAKKSRAFRRETHWGGPGCLPCNGPVVRRSQTAGRRWRGAMTALLAGVTRSHTGSASTTPCRVHAGALGAVLSPWLHRHATGATVVAERARRSIRFRRPASALRAPTCRRRRLDRPRRRRVRPALCRRRRTAAETGITKGTECAQPAGATSIRMRLRGSAGTLRSGIRRSCPLAIVQSSWASRWARAESSTT